MREGDALLNDASRRYDRVATQIQHVAGGPGREGSEAVIPSPPEMMEAMRAIADAKVHREAVDAKVHREAGARCVWPVQASGDEL